MYQDTPIVSQTVSKRLSNKEKRKQSQQKKMDVRHANHDSHSYHQSVAASGDSYIAEALKRVRKSNVTHSETLTRHSGSWLHNKGLGSNKE